MIAAEVQYSVAQLNDKLRQYAEVSNKTEAEIISKQAGKLSFNLRTALRALAPEKGAVRAERLAALKAGGGVYVRPGVYAMMESKYGVEFTSTRQKYKGPNNELAGTDYSASRRMNLQALAVQRELNLRESGRGFMAFSTPRAMSYAETVAVGQQVSRYDHLLSFLKMDLRLEAPIKYAQFEWPSDSPALEGLTKEQQMTAVMKAVNETTADIDVYVQRKLEEAKSEAGV